MRPEEAAWIGRTLAAYDLSGKTVLNVGSSTLRFRTTTQPHIEREIFSPLAARSAHIIHVDMKADEGVDLVGDLLDPAFRAKVAAAKPDFILANNLFEHVRDRKVLAAGLAALAPPGARLIVSVPRAYPYHADPIDTYFRPTPEEIAAMFADFALERGEVVVTTSLWHDIVAKLGTWRAIGNVAERVARLAFPFVRPRAWRGTLSGLAWMGRTRSVSIAVLRRHAEPGAQR